MENLIDFSDPILRLVLPILLKDQTTGGKARIPRDDKSLLQAYPAGA